MKKCKYKCKDNDVILKFIYEDNEIDEVWIGFEGLGSWTVVGYKDLMDGIEKAKKKIKIKDSHFYGGGYVGEAILSTE